MKEIHIYTDGSTLNNQQKGSRTGGLGVFFGDNDKRNISYSLKETPKFKVTNQVAELSACVKAIETIIGSQMIGLKQIIIYTDSMYIVNSMSGWASGWEKNNWKKATGKVIENKNLMIKLYYYSKNLNVIFRHVKAHRDPPSKDSEEYIHWYGNDMADKLAVKAAKKISNKYS